MGTLKFAFIWMLCLKYGITRAQAPLSVSVQRAEDIPWERYDPGTKRFVMAGEAHHVSIIHSFQLSQLNYLVSKGFRHLVWEVPYSYGFIAQQYISTGRESLLDILVPSKEALEYWRGVRALNQTLPPGDKIHLWGIDHELGDNAGSTYRVAWFRRALELILEEKGNLPSSLRSEFRTWKTDTTLEAVTRIRQRLQQLRQQPEVAAFFGERLPDFSILINRLDHYKVNRNDEMLDAFREICTLFQLDSAKFLGRFGWGHVDRSRKNSMAWLLENHPSSPVRNSLYVVGVQYLQCTSSARAQGMLIVNDGNVSGRSEKKMLAEINQSNPAPIRIYCWPSGEKRKGWAKAADVLFVFYKFPGVTPLNQKP